MSKTASLTDQRAKLAADDAEAQDALSAATHRRRTGRSDAGREVVAPLVDFTEAIRTSRPDATPEADRADRKRELIREFFDAIEERGLTLDPVRSNEGFALAVVDPSVDAEYDVALKARNEAAAALRDFDRNHGDELRAERDKADANAIREALSGDDPEAIRAALAPVPPIVLSLLDRVRDALANLHARLPGSGAGPASASSGGAGAAALRPGRRARRAGHPSPHCR